MGSQTNLQTLKKRAPVIIAVAIAIVLCAYVALEVYADTVVRGQPFSFTKTISSWGYGGIFGLMILEASSLPIPSEVILPFAGYLVSLGHNGHLPNTHSRHGSCISGFTHRLLHRLKKA